MHESSAANGALSLRHARLQDIFDSHPESIVVADELGHVVAMNPAAEALTGWSFPEARLRHITDVVMLEMATDRTCGTKEMWDRVVQTGERYRAEDGATLIGRMRPASTVAVSASIIRAQSNRRADSSSPTAGPSTNPTIYGVVITMHDVTDHRERVRSRQQRERFDVIQKTIGVFASSRRSVCSCGADASVSSLTDQPGPSLRVRTPKLRADQRAAARSENRLSSCGDEFLAMGRPATNAPAAFDPVKLMQALGHALPRMLGRHVTVIVKPSPKAGLAYADPDRVRTVLLTFALVSRTRMATGGKLTLTAHRIQFDATTEPQGIMLGRLSSGTYVRVDVGDSGSTYSVHQLLRLFEPFQFTRHNDVQQAFRLSFAYDAVRRNDGALVIASRPLFGTTFSIYLPAADSNIRVRPGISPV